jgi:hypothetical protein
MSRRWILERIRRAVTGARTAFPSPDQAPLLERPHLFAVGLFATLMWPPILLFQVMILVQVTELFMPASETVILPVFGPANRVALVLALVIALVQSVAAVAMTDPEVPRVSRWMAGSCCGMLLVYTCWGSYLVSSVRGAGGFIGSAPLSATLSMMMALTAFAGPPLCAALAYYGVLKKLLSLRQR